MDEVGSTVGNEFIKKRLKVMPYVRVCIFVDVTLKDIREWNKRRNYKEDTGITINAMMESAVKDPYVDLNPPSKF